MKALTAWAEGLDKRLRAPLPGNAAHEHLRAIPVGNKIPNFKHAQPPRLGSVLLLLFEEDGRIRFPLIKRPDYSGMHSGQVSFPGGKAEPGENVIETALREGQEEVGIHPDSIHVIGRMSDFLVIPSNFMVTPVVAYTTERPQFVADPVEVVKILMGDLNDILADDVIKVKEITVGGQFQLKAPHFEIENEVVWGATAMMLNEFRMILKEIPE
jgi:8-oxo-dGTP pyrophosphatase MutT (NUDIX family)